MPDTKIILNDEAIHRGLLRIAYEIAEKNPDSQKVAVIGVQTGGVHMAHRLAKQLESIWEHPVPVGLVDVGMHRDDLNNRPNPRLLPTQIPFDITGRTVILVDDVLFSGRTTRAALDALNDFGRAQAIQLAVLIDRGHRELPIKATYVGKNVPTSIQERISVSWKEDAGGDTVRLEKP